LREWIIKWAAIKDRKGEIRTNIEHIPAKRSWKEQYGEMGQGGEKGGAE